MNLPKLITKGIIMYEITSQIGGGLYFIEMHRQNVSYHLFWTPSAREKILFNSFGRWSNRAFSIKIYIYNINENSRMGEILQSRQLIICDESTTKAYKRSFGNASS